MLKISITSHQWANTFLPIFLFRVDQKETPQYAEESRRLWCVSDLVEECVEHIGVGGDVQSVGHVLRQLLVVLVLLLVIHVALHLQRLVVHVTQGVENLQQVQTCKKYKDAFTRIGNGSERENGKFSLIFFDL